MDPTEPAIAIDHIVAISAKHRIRTTAGGDEVAVIATQGGIIAPVVGNEVLAGPA